ncbi:unnamed protein product [Nesidiocoris tenuis]|uniref:Protein kinase domain-containing protein n=1 Tax=Nesidiocoris tenuis TaxID=355587 RepID=A0A6H5H350_9HEMI|nr:unnamed protein product [Nesidiocoris tenuis]
MVVPDCIDNIMGGLESTGGVTLHNHRRKLKQRFDIIAKLGQGTYGKVQLGVNKETGQEVAIKIIKKCKIKTEADLIRIRREIQIMSSMKHPYIIHIYEVFENRDKMVLVMEYASGGELFDYLTKHKVLEESEARRIFRQIAMGIYYCHKIADFGLTNVFDGERLLSTFCGSPLYASPEIVKGVPYYGPEVDCWSLGVLLYTLVYGAMPFDGSNFKRLVRQISAGDYFEPNNPSSASDLIRGLLTVDSKERFDITAVCRHPWMDEEGKVSCFRLAEQLAEEEPNRLDLLLALASPPQPQEAAGRDAEQTAPAEKVQAPQEQNLATKQPSPKEASEPRESKGRPEVARRNSRVLETAELFSRSTSADRMGQKKLPFIAGVKVISSAISEGGLGDKKSATLPKRRLSRPLPSVGSRDSVPKEVIIPIQIESREETRGTPQPAERVQPERPPPISSRKTSVSSRASSSSLGRQDSNSSTISVSTTITASEPIRKSPREVIIPIAVEGGGIVTPSESTLSKMSSASESLEDVPLRGFGLHSTRRRHPQPETADSISSDEDDGDFEAISTENLFTTLLARGPRTVESPRRERTRRKASGRSAGEQFRRMRQSSGSRFQTFRQPGTPVGTENRKYPCRRWKPL